MAYTTGGLIQAIDYNYFTWGGNTTGTYSGTINNLAMVWGQGLGFKGYGQDVSLIPAVSGTTTITATQWAGLVYSLNRTLGHQNGAGAQLASGSNIGITAGDTITAFANVATAIGTINANANIFTTQGTTIVGTVLTNTINFAGGSANVQTFQGTRTVTFASGNAARYFFNAGGQLRLVFVGGTNVNGTARTNDFIELFRGNIGNVIISGLSSQGIAGGSRGNVKANVTNLGYWGGLSTSDQIVANVQSAGSIYTYKTDFANVNVRTNGVQGLAGDKGSTVSFVFYASDGAVQTNSNFNDIVNATINTRVDIVAPETTYLANTWGVIGVT
jgi:hypothetical protein